MSGTLDAAEVGIAEGATVIALPGVRLGELRNRAAAEASAPADPAEPTTYAALPHDTGAAPSVSA